MRTILRAGLGALLGVALVFSTAYAIEYDDIFELNDKGVADETLVQLIVDDGRAFELSDAELSDLRAADVHEVVIDAMLDPEAGRTWLAGVRDDADAEDGDGYSTGDASGYSTSLDESYGQGYADGHRTALVYSFGYYYGPLARYYYCDPFYYPFWSAGYQYSYWPSYYATWYRPYYASYYAYPYNCWDYSSYYCYTYYDPGYWTSQGYAVQPGYGRTVWDDGPRWRDGGSAPPKGGRPDGSVVAPSKRLLDGRLVAGRTRDVNGPSAPKQIREAITGRGRTATTAPSMRTPGSRPTETRVSAGIGRRGAVERSTSGRSSAAVPRRGGMRDVSSGTVRRVPARESGGYSRVPSSERRSAPRMDSGSGRSQGRSVGRGESIRRSNGRSARSEATQRIERLVRSNDDASAPPPRYEAPDPAPAPPESRGEARREPAPPPAPAPAKEEPREERSARGVTGAVRGGR